MRIGAGWAHFVIRSAGVRESPEVLAGYVQVVQVVQVFRQSNRVQDALVWIGYGEERQQIRLISVLYQGA